MKDYIEQYVEKRRTLDMKNAYLSLTELEVDIIKSMVCSEVI